MKAMDVAFEAGAIVPATLETPATEAATKPAKAKPAPKGKGSEGKHLHTEPSKSQLRTAFEKDGNALAAVLVALGADRYEQRSQKGNLVAIRLYGRISTLQANRAKLTDGERKLASAAIDALRAVGVLRGEFFTLELFRDSVAVRSRKEPGNRHKAI